MKGETGKLFFKRKNSGSEDLSILQRIAAGDRNAVRECVEKYGDLIWTLAKRSAQSEAEAETMALKIFREIWKCAAKFEPSVRSEPAFIRHVTCRLLNNDEKDRKLL